AASELYRIKFATVADYAWNPSAYHPELSLWKALLQAYGPECAREILFFNDAYYGVYEACMRRERGEPAVEEWERRGADGLERMEHSLASLRRLLPKAHPLIGELAGCRDRQRERFEKLRGALSGPG
ncbi:MAG: protein O-GlcNAcase, partial [Desulfobacterales bacterium]|nr:protein O-GlcNAcase [Desulfobacterales bacterium]